ncbi:unnamed protein product [Protopolystoma xenopodis]|uniref:PKD domain-containing protein n=1 Tax=Protopolystoma xenopodis TaxID=117903 RepID=A0A3S5A9Y3_9PLAT|nr:unnamed protein product [Protopolystoma xenopodis]
MIFSTDGSPKDQGVQMVVCRIRAHVRRDYTINLKHQFTSAGNKTVKVTLQAYSAIFQPTPLVIQTSIIVEPDLLNCTISDVIIESTKSSMLAVSCNEVILLEKDSLGQEPFGQESNVFPPGPTHPRFEHRLGAEEMMGRLMPLLTILALCFFLSSILVLGWNQAKWLNAAPLHLPCLIPFSSSFSKDGSFKSAIWNFGDSTPLVRTTEANVTHTYAAPGRYNCTVQIHGLKKTVFTWKMMAVQERIVAFNISAPKPVVGVNSNSKIGLLT